MTIVQPRVIVCRACEKPRGIPAGDICKPCQMKEQSQMILLMAEEIKRLRWVVSGHKKAIPSGQIPKEFRAQAALLLKQ